MLELHNIEDSGLLGWDTSVAVVPEVLKDHTTFNFQGSSMLRRLLSPWKVMVLKFFRIFGTSHPTYTVLHPKRFKSSTTRCENLKSHTK